MPSHWWNTIIIGLGGAPLYLNWFSFSPVPLFPNTDNLWNMLVLLFECVLVKHVLFYTHIFFIDKMVLCYRGHSLPWFLCSKLFLLLRKKNVLVGTVSFQRSGKVLYITNTYEFQLEFLKFFSTELYTSLALSNIEPIHIPINVPESSLSRILKSYNIFNHTVLS